MDAREFILFFQPQVAVADGRVVGAEALLRWQHPGRGLIQPDDFIPLAERSVLLKPLTLSVFEQAVQWCAGLRRLDNDLHIAVNVSARTVLDLDLPEQVARLLRRFGLPPSALIIEITESTLMADPR